MKKTSKALLLALCAVLLVTASVLGTMAYLTSTATVKNTFTVGNVAITMDEKDTDDSTKDADRDTANNYKLMPGLTYTKDPTIHVGAGSEDCYLFVKVENGIAGIEADTNKISDQMDNHNWDVVDAGQGIYVYGTSDAPTVVQYDKEFPANNDVIVFDGFTVKDSVKNEELATYSDKTITVTAYAIQADGFSGKKASEIWNTLSSSITPNP